MAMRIFFTIVLCLVAFSTPGWAQEQRSEDEKVAYKAGWDEAWSWGNAFAVKTYFEQLYYPHARALLTAKEQLNSGTSPAAILKTLSGLPGVKGAVLSRVEGQSVQFPEGMAKLDSFDLAVFKRMEDNPVNPVSPMMKRTVGGKVRFAQAPTGGGMADLLVRYVVTDTTRITAAISLMLDEKWLIAQIPSAMDSLYRENVQLLFAAASPRNKIWEQSLGIVAGEDTLWWVGRKDVKIANEQILWPFESIRVPSYVHTLNQK